MNEIYKEYVNFMKEAKTVSISSIDEQGKPEISKCSYQCVGRAPCEVEDQQNRTEHNTTKISSFPLQGPHVNDDSSRSAY